MLITMPRLATEEVPDELKIVRSEVSSSTTDGALLSLKSILAEAEKVNQSVAGELNVMGYNRLRDSVVLTLTQEQLRSVIAEIHLPDRVALPVALDAVSDTNASEVLCPIWYRDSVRPDYDCVKHPNRYEIRSDVIRISDPQFTTYRLQFQRVPGSLCYGAINASSTTTSIVATTITAGTLSPRDSAYVGDPIALIQTSGAVEVRKITAYVAATKTFTVDTAFGSDPGGTETFSILSFLPDSHQDVLVYGTAAAFTDIPQRAAISGARYADRLANLKETIRPEEQRTPRTPIITRPFSMSRPIAGGGRGYGRP